MKRSSLMIVIIIFMGILQAQVPVDFIPGLRELTDSDMEYLNSLPRLKIENRGTRELPESVDNSEHEWLRPVFNQDGGSCGQASGIGYVFTYEINRLRSLAADVPENQYPDHYTWNFLNGGYGSGSWYFDGWQIVQAGGCPNIAEYGGIFAYGQSGWMDGYENYRSAMENRVDEIYAIDVGTPGGLETLKYWFYEHGNEEESGGLVCFGAGVSNLMQYELPAESPFAGELIITDWTTPVNHAITFVGYDDNICYDYNGDGQFTNDIDINNDSVVDMRDWEIGAVKMLNSWGTNWGNDGFCWVMYRTLAEPTESGGIWGNIVHCITAKEEYEPLLTLKTTISHDMRNTIRLGAGVSSTAGAQEPEMDMSFPHFNFQGGDWNMPGNFAPGAQPLEIGLDITPLLSGIEQDGDMQWWLIVESEDPSYLGNGVMVDYSIINEATQEEFICDEANWGLINDWMNYFSLEADIEVEIIEITTSSLPSAPVGLEYSYQMQAENGNEPYNWNIRRIYNETIEAGEFPVVNWDVLEVSDNDDGLANIDLPFEFEFYGESYQQVTFLTDGSVVFDDGFTYIRNDQNLKSSKCITVYGSDMMAYPEFGDGYYYYEEADKVMFRWTVSRFDQESFDGDFILVLYDDSTMEFHYNTDVFTADNNWTSGVSAGDGLNYLFSSISGESAIPEGEFWYYEPAPFPEGLEITSNGLLTGIMNELNIDGYDINIHVMDDLGIYDEKEFTLVVNTNQQEENSISKAVVLQQNYPNPFIAGSFRDVTQINYELENAGETDLKIYNIKGELVKVLIDENISAGKHTAFWDGSNSQNEMVSSGVYFYSLESSSGSKSRKLLLIR